MPPFARYPIGSGSAMSGPDYSPWLQGANMQLRQNIANAQFLQEAQQTQLELEEAAQNRQLRREMMAAELGESAATRQQRKQISDDEMAYRREGRQEARKLRDEDLQRTETDKQEQARADTEAETAGAQLIADGMSPEEARARLIEVTATLPPERQGYALKAIDTWYAGAAARGEIERERQAEDEAAAADAEKEQQIGEVTQVGTRARAIIAERADDLRAELSAQAAGPVTDEQVRDAMLAESGQSEVEPMERAAIQQAIEEWYQAEQETAPEEAAELTPYQKINYWSRQEKEVTDKIATIEGLFSMLDSDVPEAPEFARMKLQAFGGEEAAREMLQTYQKQAAEARAKIEPLLS